MKHITRKIARVKACKLTLEDVRRLNGKPLMSVYEYNNWLFDFGSWIESGYNGKATSFEEMAADFNANSKRQFTKADGTIIGFCRIVAEYLHYMGFTESSGKGYTVKRFKAFMTENYREVYA